MSEERASGAQRVKPHIVWGNLIVIVGLALFVSGLVAALFSGVAPNAFLVVGSVGTVLLSVVFGFAFWLTFPTVVVDLGLQTIRWKGRTRSLAHITGAEVFTRGVYTILRLSSSDGSSVSLIINGVPVRKITTNSKLLLARALEVSGIRGATDSLQNETAASIGSVKNSTWETRPFSLSKEDAILTLVGAPSVERLTNAPGTVAGFGDASHQPLPARLGLLASGPATGWRIIGSAAVFFGGALTLVFALTALAGAASNDAWLPLSIVLFVASAGLLALGLGTMRRSR